MLLAVLTELPVANEDLRHPGGGRAPSRRVRAAVLLLVLALARAVPA